MKLAGYTLIEGIVSMVLLSILLSVGVMVSFNLYRSYPSERELKMREVLTLELQKQIDAHKIQSENYPLSDWQFEYAVQSSNKFNNMMEVQATLTDSLGNSVSQKQLFLHYAE